MNLIDEPLVLATILRAGLPLHQGLLNYLMLQKIALFRLTENIHRRGI